MVINLVKEIFSAVYGKESVSMFVFNAATEGEPCGEGVPERYWAEAAICDGGSDFSKGAVDPRIITSMSRLLYRRGSFDLIKKKKSSCTARRQSLYSLKC